MASKRHAKKDPILPAQPHEPVMATPPPPPPATPHKTPGSVRFVSFNVCGLRNVTNYTPWSSGPRTLQDMFDKLQGDVICFQEVRVQQKDMPYDMAVVPGFKGYHSFPKIKKGYSGVGVYVRDPEITVYAAEDGLTGWLDSADAKGQTYRDLDISGLAPCIGGYPTNLSKEEGLEIDSEGRSLVLDLGFCVLFGLYCPANSLGNKEDYRNRYFEALDQRVRNLIAAGRQVVIMGDLNISRELYDNADAMEQYFASTGRRLNLPHLSMKTFETAHATATMAWRRSSPQRQMMHQWLGNVPYGKTADQILHDVCRDKHPRRMNMFTCWDQRTKARDKNFGSRIDYVFATEKLAQWCDQANILPQLFGSDHCPIYADMKIPPEFHDHASKHGSARVRPKSALKLCSMYLNGFSTRRSVSDMFAAAASRKRKEPTPAVDKAPNTTEPLKSATASPALSETPPPPSLDAEVPGLAEALKLSEQAHQTSLARVPAKKPTTPLVEKPKAKKQAMPKKQKLDHTQTSLQAFFKK